MDKKSFLELKPNKAITFQVEPKKNADSKIVLKNISGSHVIFKIKTTNQKRYHVKPISGYIKPNKEVIINISIHQEDIDEIIDDLKANRDERPDRFRVISLIIADDDQLKRFDIPDPSKLINDILSNSSKDKQQIENLVVKFTRNSFSPGTASILKNAEGKQMIQNYNDCAVFYIEEANAHINNMLRSFKCDEELYEITLKSYDYKQDNVKKTSHNFLKIPMQILRALCKPRFPLPIIIIGCILSLFGGRLTESFIYSH